MPFQQTRSTGNRTGFSPRSLPAARLFFIASIMLVCAGQSGCVFRRMTIHSDPPGALVLLDGEELGYTPVSGEFTHYGTREITLVKDGYETLTTLQKIPAPWYQLAPFEFFADNLSPVKVTNRHNFMYKLQRQQVVATEELLPRADAFRSEAQFGP